VQGKDVAQVIVGVALVTLIATVRVAVV